MTRILTIFICIYLVCSCSNAPHYHDDPIPEHETFTMMSAFTKDKRVVNVWMPEGYKNGEVALPVLYMPDGGVKEDFPHVANTLSELISSKKIKPIMLVGVENTERGRDMTGASQVKADGEYCPLTDGAKNFRAFFTEELFKEINGKYKTTSKKGIIGESLAGLFVMETFFLQPEAFDYYIAMDPSIWWNDHYLEKNAAQLLKEFPSKSVKLWFAGSDAEDISKHTKNIAKTMETSAPATLNWKYSDEPNEKHSTIYRATKEKALSWILN